MSLQQELPFEEGDSIVFEDRNRDNVWFIEEIRDHSVVFDSTPEWEDDEYPLTDVLEPIENGDLRVVPSDSPLIELPHVGSKTAPKIVAATGYETPRGLIGKYLSEGFDVDGVPNLREDAFHSALLDPQFRRRDDESAWVSTIMAFIREFGASKDSPMIEGAPTYRGSAGGYKNEEVEVKHVSFDHDEYVMDPANVCALHHDRSTLHEINDGVAWDEYVEAGVDGEAVQSGVTHLRIETEGEHTLVSGDYVKRLQNLFPFDVADHLYAHPDGEYPIFIDDPEHVGVVALAPRIE